MVIIDYYKELPDYKKTIFRKRALEITEWAESTFYAKMKSGDFKRLESEALLNLIKSIDYDSED